MCYWELCGWSSSSVAILNGVKVEAFPSYNAPSMRGFVNVKFIMSDESDFYPPFQQNEVRAVMEGYIGKPNSDPTICIVSTPKAPGGTYATNRTRTEFIILQTFLRLPLWT